MGKPYVLEVESFPATYRWAVGVDVKPIASVLRDLIDLPILTVGSGGSFTGAHFAAALHQSHARQIARAVTPFEFIATTHDLRRSGLLLVTAGGRNPDILAALENALALEPRRIVVLCFTKNSKIAEFARGHSSIDLFDFELPSGKDGFLATNSLLSAVLLLTRAYQEALGRSEQTLPKNLDKLLDAKLTFGNYCRELRARVAPLWNVGTLSVLYGADSHSAAIDLESKFTEAALGTIQLADYRNFAHGRHHWFAKRGSETSLLALVSERESDLASKTLDKVPRSIPVVRHDLSGTRTESSIAALVSSFLLAGFAGEARRIDPGRPGVPGFGRRLYNLGTLRTSARQARQDASGPPIAISRKSSSGLGSPEYWSAAYRRFIDELRTARFCAVVFDFDGTLCDASEKYDGIRAELISELERLLRGGIRLGIATGRGDSVRDDLRAKLSATHWERVLVGYHNGSECIRLSDCTLPTSADVVGPGLADVAKRIMAHPLLGSAAKIKQRGEQITVQPLNWGLERAIWDILQDIVAVDAASDVPSLVKSSHSFDILAPGVTKKALVARIREACAPAGRVLCIGDRGRWPGNDFALLREPLALSVDEVSPDAETCWNLAAPGSRGVQATLEYLGWMRVARGAIRFALPVDKGAPVHA